MLIGEFISLYQDTYIFRLLNVYDSADMVGVLLVITGMIYSLSLCGSLQSLV